MGLSSGKIFCLWMVILGVSALVLGSLAPYWLTLEASVVSTTTVRAQYGLWFWCLDDDCSTYEWDHFDWGDYTVWFYVVHVLGGLATLLALIVMLLSLCLAIQEEKSVTHIGVLALLSGVLGISAAVVFYLESLDSLQVAEGDRAWAFIVFFCGGGVVSFFSIVLLALPGSAGSNAVGPV